ncbi:hypothetical protein FQZ97_1064930 [compost metagenome]
MDSEEVAGLLLGGFPGGHAACFRRAGHPAEHLAGGHRLTCGVLSVFAQEHLMGGVRGVGLALIYPWRVSVKGVLHVVAGVLRCAVVLVLAAGEDHEA